MPNPHAAKINVLLIGGGGREHALALRIAQSPLVASLFSTHTENPGIAQVAKPVDVPASIREVYRLRQFIERENISLVVIGPEDPLAEGFVDALSSPSCKVFGPTAAAARLESDKAFAKHVMKSSSIPTPDARTFTDSEAAKRYIETREHADPVLSKLYELADRNSSPLLRRAFIDKARVTEKPVAQAYRATRSDLPVIKATGLAKGKGVIVPDSIDDAFRAIEDMLDRKLFGEAGKTILLEERLRGVEVSVLAITDGRSLLMLPPAQDHKRLLDGDKGPNTGGMGAFCPAHTIDDATCARVERDVLVPLLDSLRREELRFVGVIYAGLMLTPMGPKVLEFNCRFGDPECQAILPRLKNDIVEIMLAACDGTLDTIEPKWDDNVSCCVVIANPGYPDKPKAGAVIHGLEDAAKVPGVTIFHAGTKRDVNGNITATGGRVLSVTGLGATLEEARASAYEAAGKIVWSGMQVRSDIGAPTPATSPVTFLSR